MASSASTVVAAMAAKARREVRYYFTCRNAFSPARAAPYEPPTSMHRRQMEAMRRRGVLKETSDGRLWMDEQALRLEEERRRAQGVLLLKIIIAAAFVAIVAVAVAIALR